MNKKEINKFAKWFEESDKKQRYEIRKYIFDISNMQYCEKCIIWNKITKQALNSKQWRPKEESKTIVI